MTAVSQTFVLFVDLLKLSRLRVEFVQLFKLIRQQFRTGCSLLTLLLMLSEFTAALMPLAIVFRHKLSKRVLTCVAIKKGLLLLGFNQLLMRVLTVDLDKQLAKLAKLGKGDRCTVDKTAGTTVAADDAAE